MILKATLGKLAYISPPAHEYVITDTMSPGKLVRRCQKKCTIWKGICEIYTSCHCIQTCQAVKLVTIDKDCEEII